jgi:serine/threonine protein phosphatase PrpC
VSRREKEGAGGRAGGRASERTLSCAHPTSFPSPPPPASSPHRLPPSHPVRRILIVASDGLWDVSTADVAVRRAWESISAGRDPALDLTDWALAQHDIRGSIDNVTVIVAVFGGGVTSAAGTSGSSGAGGPGTPGGRR